VFAETGIEVSELDAIIYTKGPGAFTGVRMCVGVVQGISLAYDIPTMGFSTLEVIGFGATKKYNIDKVAVALDARMGEVYWGIYQDQKLSNESLKKPNEVDVLNQEYIGVGTGWSAYESELAQKTSIDNYVAEFFPKAENLIDLYLNRIDKGGDFDDKLPLPTYLRNNVAQKSLK
jgi:tRNA threonylcarbamoyladenosine biosynthesis protein TsaB